MKVILLTSIFLIPIPVFADDIQRELEYVAIILFIKKYGNGLNPSYRSWYENNHFVSVAAGNY